MAPPFMFSKMIRWVIAVVLFFSVIQYTLRSKKYTFSPKEFRRIAEKHAGEHPGQSASKLIRDLRSSYYTHIIPDNELQWITFSAGGMNGKLMLLHGSITEYMMIIGSPYGTEGHSGIHWVNQTCTVLIGNFKRMGDQNSLTPREEYGAGDNMRQFMFTSSLVEFEDDTWLLCYGRGFVPTSGVYFSLDSIRNIDPVSPAKLAFVYGQSVFRQMAIWTQETLNYYTGKLGK